MNSEDRLYLAEMETQRLGKTVIGVWQFFFILGLAGFILRAALYGGRDIWDAQHLEFLWFGFGLLTAYSVLKRWPGRYVLFGLLGVSVLAVLAPLAYGLVFEESEHKVFSSLFFLLVLSPSVVPFGMLCRVVVRMRKGRAPAEAHPSQPFLDQMECLLRRSRERGEGQKKPE